MSHRRRRSQSTRKRRESRHPPLASPVVMDAASWRAEAQHHAECAHDFMMAPAGFDSYDWPWVVDQIVAADAALRAARELDPSIEVPLLEEVIEELRDLTGNFTRPEFLQSTRPSRRDRPELFLPRR